MRNDSTCADNCMCANVHAWQDAGIHSNVGADPHRDRPDQEIGRDNWLLQRQTGVG
jgi:hypothetical protein